jgi:hypothetical protein
MMKNITLSADDEVIAKARSYAKEHNTTLNQIMRDYLVELIRKQDSEALAEEFDKLVQMHAGYPEESWRFNREEIHQRGGHRD